MVIVCCNCQSRNTVRVKRTAGERLRGVRTAWNCRDCGRRFTPRQVKHCWRCGSDLDRRRRSQWGDYLMAIFGLRPYSCRRCAVRRYRKG